MSKNIEMLKTYNITTVAPQILGDTYKNLKVTGIVGYDTIKNKINAVDIHNSILDTVDSVTDKNPEDLIYYTFTDSSNKEHILAEVWIDSAELVTSVGLIIELEKLSVEDRTKIHALLTSGGYSDNIKKISNVG